MNESLKGFSIWTKELSGYCRISMPLWLCAHDYDYDKFDSCLGKYIRSPSGVYGNDVKQLRSRHSPWRNSQFYFHEKT